MKKRIYKRKYAPFGLEVKKILLERDIMAEELAREVGISPQYLNKILFGDIKNSSYVDKIREILGISA